MTGSGYEEFTGKSVEDALRQAREAFGVTSLDDLDFEILTAGSRGVLGMGAEPARIVAAPRAALGGAAPRRESAEAVPVPRPAVQERVERIERAGPSPERPPREAESRRPREEGGEVRRAERPDRPGRGRDRRPEGRGERPLGGAAVSAGEEAEVLAARAATTEHDEGEPSEVSPEALQAGRAILTALMAHLGYDVTVDALPGETSRINVVGANESERRALGALIGRKGERLSALQHLLNLMLSKQMGEWTRVLVDVEGYRGRRERQLREIAQRAAQRVEETGRMLQLEPMTALERRWIHLALRGHGNVVTQSIGEEPERRVVVLPRGGEQA
jgi:spoIIIJ-associated protein